MKKTKSLRRAKAYLIVEDKILANMVKDRKPAVKLKCRESFRRAMTNRNIASGELNITPKNSSFFGLREGFLYMKEERVSAHKFYQLTTDKTWNSKHPKVLCSRSTFCRNHNKYSTTIILPKEDTEVIAMGRSQYIADGNLKLLNSNINETIGLAENNYTLSENILNVKTKIDIKCGQFDYSKTSNTETIKYYQLLTV